MLVGGYKKEKKNQLLYTDMRSVMRIGSGLWTPNWSRLGSLQVGHPGNLVPTGQDFKKRLGMGRGVGVVCGGRSAG